jgi:hypothetical protein
MMVRVAKGLHMTEQQAERVVRHTSGRCWKLPVTFLGLALMTAATIGCLIAVATANQEPLCVLSIPVQRSWLIAALGGAIGGLAKAYYSFVVENHAFEYKRITGHSSPWAKDMLRLKSLDQMEDDFDPLEVWYLYFVKPLVGATLGLIFALTIDIGLITLGAKIDDGKHTTRLVVMAAMAGLFAENVLSRLQGFFMTAKDT